MSLNDLLIYLEVAAFGLSLLFLHGYIAIRKALKTDIEIYLWNNKYNLLRCKYKFKGRKEGFRYKPYLEHGYKSGNIFLDLYIEDSNGVKKIIETKISLNLFNIQSVEFCEVKG